jgi:hypothetical protein
VRWREREKEKKKEREREWAEPASGKRHEISIFALRPTYTKAGFRVWVKKFGLDIRKIFSRSS